MSDYREITLADAWKRIGYYYGIDEVQDSDSVQEPPNVTLAMESIVRDINDLHDAADIMTGINDAIRDSQQPAASATRRDYQAEWIALFRRIGEEYALTVLEENDNRTATADDLAEWAEELIADYDRGIYACCADYIETIRRSIRDTIAREQCAQ